MENHNDQTALGMVETYGYIAHVEAADACLKAANVSLIGSEKVKGGYMLVKVTGDVGAVKAAIDAAKAAVEALGLKAVTHVIPRPSQEVQMLILSQQVDDKKSISDVEPVKNDEADAVYESYEEGSTKEIQDDIKREDREEAQGIRVDKKTSKADSSDLDISKLSKMNVAKLRAVARSLENISLDKNQINFGKKQELIKAILGCLEKEGK